MQTRLTPDTASLPNEALPAVLNDDAFWPYEPKSLEESGLSDMALESIVLQTFLAVGTVTGRGMTDRVKLPFRIIEQLLAQLRVRQLIAHARPAPLNDFYYSLTEAGQKRAVHYQSICSYTGPAPVPLMDYVLSVEAQASTFEPITRKQLLASFENVTFEPSWLDFIGPAINSNSGIFLYGPPGNGKTTLAKCLAACRGEEIWIPHAIIEDGIIIKFFDAAYHQPTKQSVGHSGIVTDQEHDRRWIRVRRPTVVVGGELTMDHLEIRHDERSNTCEAPLQMRSNCGCLLIDDFGRQRMEPAELLNRWIIPLENRHDYLSLPTGKKFCVPFEQIILFSTNLQPESLVDEAFLRRVPFKIHIGDPTAEEFTELFRMTCESFDVQWRPEVVEELMLRFYKKSGRALRRCHPRDLLHQIRCLCAYRGERMELRTDYLEIACKNYFGNKIIVSEDAPPRYAGKVMGGARGEGVASNAEAELREMTEPVPQQTEVNGGFESGTYVVTSPLGQTPPISSRTVYNPSVANSSGAGELRTPLTRVAPTSNSSPNAPPETPQHSHGIAATNPGLAPDGTVPRGTVPRGTVPSGTVPIGPSASHIRSVRPNQPGISAGGEEIPSLGKLAPSSLPSPLNTMPLKSLDQSSALSLGQVSGSALSSSNVNSNAPSRPGVNPQLNSARSPHAPSTHVQTTSASFTPASTIGNSKLASPISSGIDLSKGNATRPLGSQSLDNDSLPPLSNESVKAPLTTPLTKGPYPTVSISPFADRG